MKIAIKSFPEADASFKGLERAIPQEIDRHDWDEAENRALLERGEALHIFDVQADKGMYCI